MICTYCPKERLLPVLEKNGEVGAEAPDYALLRGALLNATVHVGSIDRYSPATTVTTLNKLLDVGLLNAEEYLELLPEGVLVNRETILEKFKKKGVRTDE